MKKFATAKVINHSNYRSSMMKKIIFAKGFAHALGHTYSSQYPKYGKKLHKENNVVLKIILTFRK